MIKTGIRDSYGREINYMRISITDRCNLRCCYCMPDGADWIPMKDILTYEEITAVCQEAVKLGITRFKITGGEPLVRRECSKLIRMIKEIPGTEVVTLTTNGLLLGEQLESLMQAGLDAVNISLDTLDKEKYKQVTGFDKLSVVLASITKAVESGIPVKINAVLQKGMNEEEWLPLTQLAKNLPLSVRFIEMMPIGYGNIPQSISNEELKEKIMRYYGNLTEDFRIYGNGPAVYYSIERFKGNIGFISAIHGKFCDKCNRIRLTSQGMIKPCLCYGKSYNLKEILRDSGEKIGTEDMKRMLKQRLETAILEKPEQHCFEHLDDITEKKDMIQIGG